MSHLLTWDNLASLASLTALEIVLGIDNVVFISILTDRLPPHQQGKARRIGLALALFTRLALLGAVSWLVRLTEPLLDVFGKSFSGRDLILIGGGLFLVFKATKEVYEKLEVPGHAGKLPRVASFGSTISMIVALDIVFSLDSVITAVGMSSVFAVMATAVILAVAVMLLFVNPISAFVNRHPSMKVLALSFLLLIGVTLIVEGTGGHFERGYVYFAMAFSLGIELVNMRMRKAQHPVELTAPFTEERSKAQ